MEGKSRRVEGYSLSLCVGRSGRQHVQQPTAVPLRAHYAIEFWIIFKVDTQTQIVRSQSFEYTIRNVYGLRNLVADMNMRDL